MTEHFTSDLADFLESAEDTFATIVEQPTVEDVLSSVTALPDVMCRAIVHAHALTAWGERNR